MDHVKVLFDFLFFSYFYFITYKTYQYLGLLELLLRHGIIRIIEMRYLYSQLGINFSNKSATC